LLLGICFIMKQPGLLFAVFAGFYLLLLERGRQLDIKRLLSGLGAYSLGVALPFLLTCLILFKAGVFEKFWFWTFSYASLYATNVGIGDGSRLLRDAIVGMAGPLLFVLVLAVAGLVLLFWDRQARERVLFAGGFALFSFLAVSVGLYYRVHYFIMLWPAMAMLVGVAMAVATRKLSARSSLLRAVPWACLFIAFGFAIYDQRDLLFEMGPLTACRNVYLENPFPEAIDIADYIREHSSPEARIAVLGSEPEIYFYAHRHSATGYIYTYGLMEPQKYALKMQKEMIAEIEAAQPEFLVFADMNVSWLIRPDSNPLIFMWAKDYMQQYYDLVGIADISANTQFRWGAEAQFYHPRSAYKMMVLRRKARPAP
jgi:hypothetical protein